MWNLLIIYILIYHLYVNALKSFIVSGVDCEVVFVGVIKVTGAQDFLLFHFK